MTAQNLLNFILKSCIVCFVLGIRIDSQIRNGGLRRQLREP